MATSVSYQAQVTVTAAQYADLVLSFANGKPFAAPTNVTILSATQPGGAGTPVTVVFGGSGLGSWATPVPPACQVGITPDGTSLLIQPVGGSSSSSSGL